MDFIRYTYNDCSILIIAIFLRRFARVVRKTRASVNSAIQETVTGVSVIKGFNREEQTKKILFT